MKIKPGKKNDLGNEVAAERVEHNLVLIKKNFFPCDKVFVRLNVSYRRRNQRKGKGINHRNKISV